RVLRDSLRLADPAPVATAVVERHDHARSHDHAGETSSGPDATSRATQMPATTIVSVKGHRLSGRRTATTPAPTAPAHAAPAATCVPGPGADSGPVSTTATPTTSTTGASNVVVRRPSRCGRP